MKKRYKSKYDEYRDMNVRVRDLVFLKESLKVAESSAGILAGSVFFLIGLAIGLEAVLQLPINLSFLTHFPIIDLWTNASWDARLQSATTIVVSLPVIGLLKVILGKKKLFK